MRFVRAACWLVVATLCGCSDWREQSFENYDALEKSDLIRKGWVPACVPDTTGRIDIAWNNDLNLYRLRVRTNESAFVKAAANLREISGADLPEGVNADPFALDTARKKLRIRCDPANVTVVAFDAGVAYYWNLRSSDAIASLCRRPDSAP